VLARSFEHPARVADLLLNSKPVGRLFELHPALMDQGRAAVLDINLDLLEELQPKDVRYTAINRFPSSAFDLSVVVPERALVGDIQKELAHLAGTQLEKIEFVRQYSGPPLPAGTKSLSYRLTIAAQDHTLSSEEITRIREGIIDGMRRAG
jgi:phenylalanyl-tRNA synthetase beta chain